MARALLIAALVWLGLQIAIVGLVTLTPNLAQNVAALGLLHAAVLGGATWFATRPQERGAIVAGFRVRSVGTGMVLGVCLKLPADGLRNLVEYFRPTDPEQLRQQLEFLRHDNWWQTLLLFVVIGCTGPLMEEVFYRGFVFRALRRESSQTRAIGLSTVLFVIAHPSLSDWPSLLLVGLVLGGLRAADGNLWSAFGAHAAFNGATVLAVVLGVQGVEGESNFPLAAAVVSAGLAAGLLTLRFRRT